MRAHLLGGALAPHGVLQPAEQADDAGQAEAEHGQQRQQQQAGQEDLGVRDDDHPERQLVHGGPVVAARAVADDPHVAHEEPEEAGQVQPVLELAERRHVVLAQADGAVAACAVEVVERPLEQQPSRSASAAPGRSRPPPPAARSRARWPT
ncbi:hypothetical protein ON010_g17247 [Phytophthora cinnamomi]|nr:hypothetical protein ON010_g17247 [Phytophthora cinnamomi]